MTDKGKRPLFPLDLGPRVRLTDEQHVAVWVASAVAVAAAIALGVRA